MQLVLEETGTYSMSSDLPVLLVNMSVIIQPMGTLQRSWEKTWPGSSNGEKSSHTPGPGFLWYLHPKSPAQNRAVPIKPA